jgi:hypothetical protein
VLRRAIPILVVLLLGACSALLLALPAPALSQAAAVGEPPDSLSHYWHEPVLVEAPPVHTGAIEILLDKSNQVELLREHGFAIIDRGPAFASDLYLDGLKREDIALRIDGERYPCACPNRMDTPVSRINPLELASCSVDRSSTTGAGGLGGSLEFRRAEPAMAAYQAALSGRLLGGDDYDLALAGDWRGYRLTARRAEGGPYEDGGGRDFVERYGSSLGYGATHRYRLTEFSTYGGSPRWRQGASYSRSADVVFPYLLMDERKTEFWSLFSEWRGHKVYLNHTRHLMDNALRNQPLLMVSDADNLTVGVAGPVYEVYYRRWDIANSFHSPQVHIDNAMIPDLRLVSAALNHGVHPAHGVTLAARAGLQRQWLGNESRVDFYQPLYPEARAERWFLPFGLMANVARPLGALVGGVQADIGSEPPDPRDLFLAVQKPMGKPWSSGNPTLEVPLRATLRTRWRGFGCTLEGFATQIWDYAGLAAATLETAAGPRTYQTVKDVDAQLLGANLAYAHPRLALRLSALLGRNLSTDGPLAEVPPLALETTLRAPQWRRLGLWLRHTWTDAQYRVDRSQGESPTPSWTRVDLGANWRREGLALSLELHNVGDVEYAEHLSYQRDPFAAKERVYAPGRQLRLALSLTG